MKLNEYLNRKLSATVTQDYTQTGGIEAIVEILNGVDRGTERTIFDSLEIQDPELAEEIKKRMFVFEDIVNLDNRSIQRIIRDFENEDFYLHLKFQVKKLKRLFSKICPTVWQKHLKKKWNLWDLFVYVM